MGRAVGVMFAPLVSVAEGRDEFSASRRTCLCILNRCVRLCVANPSGCSSLSPGKCLCPVDLLCLAWSTFRGRH